MRRNIIICLITTVLLSSCAYQGVVVEKRFRPLPFSASLGVDAMYNFQLRGNAGQTNSQMVTPDVFATYRVGDYFNDLQPPPAHDDKELEGFRLLPREMDEGPYQPVRVMQMRAPQKAGANVAVAYHRVDCALKIPRWQTVRVVQIQAPERIMAKIAIPAQNRLESGSRISRLQTVRIVQIQTPDRAVARVAIHSLAPPESAPKIPRWQTVKIVRLPAPQTTAPKVAIRASGRVEDVKILRWQTVRIVQTQSSATTTAKAAFKPAHPARTVVKTAASYDRSQHRAKIVRDIKKRAKVASTHHRKAVASLN